MGRLQKAMEFERGASVDSGITAGRSKLKRQKM